MKPTSRAGSILFAGLLVTVAPGNARGATALESTVAPATPGGGSRGPRTHDGFFFRIGLNVAPLRMTHEYTVRVPARTYEEQTVGLTSGLDWMFGGTPIDGLVIGGVLIAATTWPASSTSFGDPAGTLKEPRAPLPFAGVAAFANYYFDARSGFHLQALLGFSAFDFVSSGSYPTGPMFGAGVGYDSFFADEWSIGPFARLLYATASAESSAGSADHRYIYILPSIGVAVTMH